MLSPERTAKPANTTAKRKISKHQSAHVILGIIDDGIPFAHQAFRKTEDPERTRVNAYWHQSAKAVAGGHDLFGRSFSGQEINRLIASHQGNEDAIYRAAGVLSDAGSLPMPLDGAYSHGAHTLGVMAGHWPKATEENISIVAVDLPSTSSWDTSGFGKDTYVLAGLHYIFARADEIAADEGVRNAPLIINLSYGHTGGAHDGSNILEAAIDELVKLRRKQGKPTLVVMPTGNSFNQLLHAEITDLHFGDGQPVELNWVVQPQDKTSSFLEIWYPVDENPDDYDLTIKAPDGEIISPLKAGAVNRRPGTGGTVGIKTGPRYCEISTEFYRNKRWRVMLAIAPTEPRNLAKAAAPAGYWRIRMRKNQPNPKGTAAVQMWIQRDESFGQGNTGAKQSVFSTRAEDDLYAGTVPVPLIRRFGSMNGMATGQVPLTAAGLVASNWTAAKYSGAGTLRPFSGSAGLTQWAAAGKQVQVSSVTERSDFLPGIVGLGTRSGTRVALSGTSAASPSLARSVAESFLAGLKPANIDETQSYADMLVGLPSFKSVTSGTSPSKAGMPRLGRLAKTAV